MPGEYFEFSMERAEGFGTRLSPESHENVEYNAGLAVARHGITVDD
jgi:hypothetical protein